MIEYHGILERIDFMSKETFYITTPIYYMSGELHIGNTYPTVLTDTMARYKKMRGYDVKFLTGTDDHGQKVERMSAKTGKTPQDFVDGLAELSKNLWKTMNCEYDIFMRTTLPFHAKACQKIFRTLYEKGDIYLGKYEGLYCVECETFFKNAPDGLCSDCGRQLSGVTEECYFFRMSKYADKLIKYIHDNPEFIRPESRRNETLGFLKGGLEDIAVSRTTIKWGIPVDFDPKHVIYVWFDALPNYATALGFYGEDDSDYRKYWPAVHVIGKDILRFHTIIWPTMMMALGEPLPKTVFVTGWLLSNGGKMSKSKGNSIDPIDLAKRYGVDALRYFLMREVVQGQDGNYSEDSLINRINSDLANDLGNLLSRTVGMIEKYFEGKLPAVPKKMTSFDDALISTVEASEAKASQAYDRMAFSEALSEIWVSVRRANKYVDETEPWLLHRSKETEALARVLYMLCETLRHTAILISPVMPGTSAEIFRQLGIWDDKLKTWESLKFGKLPCEVKIEKGETLFPRIDVKAIKETEAEEQAVPSKPQITIDDFGKLDLRVGIVKECVKASEKLLKSQVDIGSEMRQILSGIAQWYAPEDMVGRRVVVVTNLKPIKLRGFLSEGMLLAAGEGTDDDPVKLVAVDGEPAAGTFVR